MPDNSSRLLIYLHFYILETEFYFPLFQVFD